MFVKKYKALTKINLFFWWINSPSFCILQFRSIVDTLKFYASNQAVVHGLKWTKCSAVRNFHKNATERFLQTSKEYQIFA